ncbi:tripartite tricarboxylate transporter substrate binding protein [Nocardioides sp. zg-1228]|uniref:Bug family tripartite tricarboxylate transporter substrate binding protein n=1 Tax=Nocardioides sp. zg-1228 TaxID=2763008 RepID=UPI00164343A5|nr:tripartite tricarboxylate transporter substrate-binding protein [Nocardioides sp. zg-1228]MBC2933325.1 tripartite tricarboxylate transporter substrate binding protein [Nocardioides sp. zg-1228]QSF56516.1 tripartite tricarboxylate transporter substrate binding protein [Nocardioides sp. zg-1228]
MLRQRTRRVAATATALATVVLLATGCGVTRGDASDDMTMLIPNSPGGGYDQTGRAAVAVMENGDITGGSFEVTNVIGAGGSVAMTRLMNAEGDERTMMTAGLGVVGSLYSFGAPYRLDDATPLAQLIADQEGVLVPADSPFETIDDLVAAWQDDPGSVVVGGGSSPGGPDHLFPMQLAGAVDVDPRELRYVAYDGGGPLTSALLGNKIDVGFSGVGEFVGQLSSGELRLLAVSGEERLDGEGISEAPTLTESGIDLVFTNWRGVFAPPGISEERRQDLIADLEAMHATPEWQRALEENGWIDEFKTGDDFATFLREQDERVATTLEELDLL